MTEHLLPAGEVVAAYVGLRARVIELVRSRPESDGDLVVPHCPAWRVRDLVAHIAGGPEDVLAGRLEGVATDAWTQAQVDRHRGETLEQLADAWQATAAGFDAVLPLIPVPTNSQVVVDATTHEHDLRCALGAPGARDDLAVEVSLGWVLHIAEGTRAGLAAELMGLGLEPFDLLRVCSGRRSRTQIAELGVDAGLVDELVQGTPVSVPDQPVVE